MRFFHISDLHIGIQPYGRSMLEEQRHILEEIEELAVQYGADGIIIAGDVYDRGVPPVRAVELFDKFITGLAEKKISAYIISGNHDNAERLSFGSAVMRSEGIYIADAYCGEVKPVTVYDEYGEINIYLLPYIRPSDVEGEIHSFDEAVRCAVEKMGADESKRNIIVSHQFVTGAQTSQSEEIIVGGTDNIGADIYSVFDYAALGHIHRPQKVGGEFIRYSGTPLKYSFSEENDKKSIVVTDVLEKGNVRLSYIPLTPLHDMRTIRGTYNELMCYENYADTEREDYIRAVLADEYDVPYAVQKLREVYPNLLQLQYDNNRTRSRKEITDTAEIEQKTPSELFGEFYKMCNGAEMSGEEREIINSILEDMEI